MANTKPVGVAFSDPELVAGTTITGATITGATIDSTTKINSNIASGFSISQQGATIAVTTGGTNDVFVIAPAAGSLSAALFSGVDALTASDTNYITFSITNLGQAGAGSAAMLAATNPNTTKATGGTAIVANGKFTLTLNGTAANLVVAAGDRLRIRATVSGTLANTVTFPVYSLSFTAA
ncbi:MAG: hypothetical protein WCJ62_00055 [Flavobacterium sp.]